MAHCLLCHRCVSRCFVVVRKKRLKPVRYWLSVDPGTPLGYAWWRGSKLLRCGVFSASKEAKKYNWFWQTQEQMGGFRIAVDSFVNGKACLEVIVCEWPQHFRSPVGEAAATRGDIVKLSATVGWVMAIADYLGTTFKPAPVMQWKGQLSKGMVQSRIKKIMGKREWSRLKPKSHAVDAIGIGYWHLGVF